MSSGFRVLHLVRPFLGFLPEVKAADRKIPGMGRNKKKRKR